jgi:hypothetical protein
MTVDAGTRQDFRVEASLKAVRSKFTNGAVIKTLESVDANLGATIKALYERTIDFGAHPNEQGVAGSMTLAETPDRRRSAACSSMVTIWRWFTV